MRKTVAEMTPEEIEHKRAIARKSYQANRESRLEYARNRDSAKKREAERKYKQKIRDEAFLAYGTVCACCGESNKKFLTFDHPNNDGAAHRKSLSTTGLSNESNQKVLRALRRQGFPVGALVTLCWNCNSGRHYNGGVCPHLEVE